MDSELKQVLKLEGLDKIKALADIVGDVNKSLAKRTEAERHLKKAIEETATAEQITHGLFGKEQDLIANLANARSKARERAVSDNGKITKSYFEIGEELRRTEKESAHAKSLMAETMLGLRKEVRESAREMRIAREGFTSLGGYIGEEFAGKLNTAFMKFDELKFVFEASAVAGENFRGKLGGIMTAVGSFGIPIAAMATGITMAIETFQKLAEAAEKAREEMHKTFLETATEYFNLSKQQQIEMRSGERGKLEGEIRELTAKRIELNASISTSVQERITKAAVLLDIDKQLAERQKELRVIDVQIKKLTDDILEAKKKASEGSRPTGPGSPVAVPEGVAYDENTWFWMNHEYNTSDFFFQRMMKGNALGQPVTPLSWNELQGTWAGVRGAPGKMGGLGTGVRAGMPNIPLTLGGVDAKPMNWSWASDVKGGFKEIDGEAKAFSDTMKSMMGSIAGSITNQIGGAFRKVFGEGENLAADLFTTIVTTFLNFGLTSSFRGMGFMAGGGVITEPYIARGLHSGRMLALGEKGPEMVTPMNHMTGTYLPRGGSDTSAVVSSVNGLMASIASGKWEVEGTRLVYLTNKVSRIYGASKM